LTWAEFRKRYEAEKLVGLAPGTRATAGESLDCFEHVINPDRVIKLTAAMMSKFQAECRKPRTITKGDRKTTKLPMKDTTIARHLRHINAALRWGVKVGKPPASKCHGLLRAKS
jgi:hypothetical protein